MPRYLIKVKGQKIDYMLMPKGMTMKQLEQKRQQHGIGLGSLKPYSSVRAKNMTNAINILLKKQGKIAPTEHVRFKKVS